MRTFFILFLKHEADSFIDGVKKSLSGKSKSGKLEALAEMQRETRERLLFNFIRDNKDEVFYSVLKNEPWAKKHSAYVDKWMNSKAGDKTSVFAKLLDAKLKVLSDSVSQEPEQTKKKSPKRSFDMER